MSTEDLFLEQSNIPYYSIVPCSTPTFKSPTIGIRHFVGLKITDTFNKQVC